MLPALWAQQCGGTGHKGSASLPTTSCVSLFFILPSNHRFPAHSNSQRLASKEEAAGKVMHESLMAGFYHGLEIFYEI